MPAVPAQCVHYPHQPIATVCEPGDGQVFNILLADVPESKTELVQGHYELPVPKGKTGAFIFGWRGGSDHSPRFCRPCE